MEKEIKEQEILLQGYQRENERLMNELKESDNKQKAIEKRMFSENQKLRTEIAQLQNELDTTQSRLDQKMKETPSNTTNITPPSIIHDDQHCVHLGAVRSVIYSSSFLFFFYGWL